MSDDDLPEFCTFQMQEEVHVDFGLNTYVDRDGDVWFAEGDSIEDLPPRHFLLRDELEMLLEASREVTETEVAPEP